MMADLLPFIFILKEMFLNSSNPPKKKMAKNALHQIVNGGGSSIYLPSAPDVLIQSMARLSSNR